MTKLKAQEILSTDKISEDQSGFYMIPGQRVLVNSDMVKQEDETDRIGDVTQNLEWNKAHLFAFVDKGRVYRPANTNEDHFCSNFYVKFEHDVWLRNFFDDALDVIEALQVINGYEQ